MADTRTLIYCRISDDREGAGLGVARQEADCRQLAERLRWTVVDVLTDNDLSAYTGKRRPGYERLLTLLADGQADAVVAWHTDRLHRSPAELETFIDVVERNRVKIQTVTAGPLDLSNATGRMVARLLGAVSRGEVEHNVERIRSKRAEMVAAGKWAGGRRPFGYESDGVTIRESEAVEIRRATEAVIGGASLRSLASDWNSRGITTTYGSEWQSLDLRRVLLRPRNAGHMVHHGEIVGTAEWPAIVEDEMWRACRAVLTDPRRRTSPGAARRYLGSGLFLCGVCENPVSTTSTRGATSYACPRYHVTRRADLTDQVVEAAAVSRLLRPDAAVLTRPHGPDLSGLHVQAQALRGRKAELARMLGAGDLDAGQFVEANRPLAAKLEDVERQLDAGASRSVLAQFAGSDVRAVWDGMDVERRRSVVGALFVVTLQKGAKGRPKGWKPGEPYFDRSTVELSPR